MVSDLMEACSSWWSYGGMAVAGGLMEAWQWLVILCKHGSGWWSYGGMAEAGDLM